MNLTSASTVVIGGRIVGRLFDFAAMLVLARLLTPNDFGLVALAMVGVTIAEGVTELPIGQVLLREASPTHDMYATAFTLAMIRSGLLLVGLSIGGFGVAAVIGDGRLAPLMAALAIAPALRGLVSPRLTEFYRRLDYRRDMIGEICGKAAGLIVAAVVATESRSYWSIAAATIVSPVIQTSLSYIFAPFRPKLILSEWHRFAHFVKWGSMTQILNMANWQSARFILGLVRTTDLVGRFSFASDICGLPYKIFVEPLSRPIYTRFAQDKHAGLDLRTTYLRFSALIMIMGAPIYLFLSAMSDPLVRLLLGERWLTVSPVISFIALLWIGGLPTFSVSSWALTVGRAAVLTARSATEFVIVIPVQFLGAKYAGIDGILGAQFLSGLIMLIVNMSAAKSFGCRYTAQIHAIHRPVLALAAMAIMLALARQWEVGGPIAYQIIWLVVVAAIAGSAYALALYGIWRLEGSPQGTESSLLEVASRFFGKQFIHRD